MKNEYHRIYVRHSQNQQWFTFLYRTLAVFMLVLNYAGNFAFAQTKIDSLQQILKTSGEDTSKVKILNALAQNISLPIRLKLINMRNRPLKLARAGIFRKELRKVVTIWRGIIG